MVIWNLLTGWLENSASMASCLPAFVSIMASNSCCMPDAPVILPGMCTWWFSFVRLFSTKKGKSAPLLISFLVVSLRV